MKWFPDPPLGRALLTGALVLAAAYRMAGTIAEGGASFQRRHYCSEGTDRNVEAGHALLHGLPHDNVFWSMPAGTVANALMCRQPRADLVLAAPAAAFLVDGLMVFGLGALQAAGPGGGLALALFSWVADPEHVFSDRWLFTLSLLLVAYLAVWRARSPSTLKTGLLAAAAGLSLNVLSALFLLPALLAAVDWRESRGRPRRDRLHQAALLMLVPCLLLIPWALTSWSVTGRVAFLESGRSDTNVITGALGHVRTVGPGSSRELAGIPIGHSAPAWAAGEVARHPLRFVAAVARRLRLAASFEPFVLAAALLSLWLFRRRPASVRLGAVLLYFLVLHCLMPVEERYFIPLWPLAAAAAAGLAGVGRGEPARLPWAAGLAAWAFVPLAALVLYAQGLVLAYPSRAARPDAWERELARAPERAWLLAAAGKRLLREGRPAEAATALTRSLEIAPLREREQWLSWALIVQGAPAPLAEDLARDPDSRLATRQLVMHALAHLRAGRVKDASEAMARAERVQASRSASWGVNARAATLDSLRGAARDLIQYWPRADRLRILAGLDAMTGGGTVHAETREALTRVEKIVTGRLTDSGRAEALRALGDAEALGASDAQAVRRVAEEYLRLGEPQRAVDALRRLATSRPRDLDLRIDLALLARAHARPEAALAALDEARALRAVPRDRRRLADAYRELGELRRAATLLWPLTTDRTNPRALEDRAALARLYAELGEHGKALTLLDELVRRAPGDATARNDRGVALLLLGRRMEAEAELRRALELDPGRLAAALSLGTLLSSTGRGAQAREVYDRALAAPPSSDVAMRGRLIAERTRLSAPR